MQIMREPLLTTIFTADSSAEAESVIRRLRTAGFHPAELALTTPIPFERMDSKFLVEVPLEEAEKARNALEIQTRLTSP